MSRLSTFLFTHWRSDQSSKTDLLLNTPRYLPRDRPFKTRKTVPGYFRQSQNTFGGARTLLTVNFTFGICETLLAPPKPRWKPQNTSGTVPALFTPL
jgi:hypothetical protein